MPRSFHVPVVTREHHCPRKLGIEEAHAVAILDGPPKFDATLGALPTGLVDNKVCAVDDIWSGLRLVSARINRRLELPH